VCVILAGSSFCRTKGLGIFMDLVDVGRAAADFLAAASFDGARQGFVFRIGEHGLGDYRDGATKKAQARSLVTTGATGAAVSDATAATSPTATSPTGAASAATHTANSRSATAASNNQLLAAAGGLPAGA
jgi:hypothetical protein